MIALCATMLTCTGALLAVLALMFYSALDAGMLNITVNVAPAQAPMIVLRQHADAVYTIRRQAATR
jgi:hypothetical protein